MMTSRRWMVLGFAVSLMAAAGAQAQAGSAERLNETLRRLDAASAKFKSAQADYVNLTYTPPIPDPEQDSGMIYFVREGSATSMGATAGGAPRYDYKNGTVRVYLPRERCYNAYGGGKDKSRIESFLTLGFGGSGKALAQSWEIKDDGPETLEGTKVEKLELTGKEQSVRDQVKEITIWVDPDRAVSLKQELYFTSGGRRTATYSKINTAEKIDFRKFAIPQEAKACH